MWRRLTCPVCGQAIDRGSVAYAATFACPHCGTSIGFDSRLRKLLIKAGVGVVMVLEFGGRAISSSGTRFWIYIGAAVLAVMQSFLFEAPTLSVREPTQPQPE